MAMVRDPAFWKRFSLAVHLDEEAQAQASRPELKHSYVEPLHSPTPASPSTTQRPSTTNTTTRLFSPASSRPNTRPQTSTSASNAPEDITVPTPTTISAPPHPPPSSPRCKITKTKTTTTTSEIAPASKPPLYARRNASQLTLGLSGRPPSRFKFWTSISADPQNRESWLEEQQRKKSKRTCMCWGFWLVFFAFVAGIVVTILLLKSKGII